MMWNCLVVIVCFMLAFPILESKSASIEVAGNSLPKVSLNLANSKLMQRSNLQKNMKLYRGGFVPVNELKKCVSLLVDPTIAGGLLSGGLHAVTGPDHLAAILPSSFGHNGWYGFRIGAMWGLGHGISATALGLSIYFLKDRVTSQFLYLKKLSVFAETAVGLSLLIIGFLGMKESIVTNTVDHLHDGHHREHHQHHQEQQQQMEQLLQQEDLQHVDKLKFRVKLIRAMYRKSLFFNGLLHGLSWDGAPSIAPAMTMSSWKGATVFLLTYCVGTMAAMSFTAAIVGEVSRKLGNVADDPDLPRRLSLVSSFLAALIGTYWLTKAAIKHGLLFR